MWNQVAWNNPEELLHFDQLEWSVIWILIFCQIALQEYAVRFSFLERFNLLIIFEVVLRVKDFW